MRLAPLIGVTSLFLAGCDNVLDLRVQAETLCVPAASQSFTGATAPPGPLPLPGTSSKTVMVDFSKALKQIPGEQAGLDLKVWLDQVFIRSMTADLAFIKRVKVTLAPGTASDMLPPVPIGEYVKPATTTMTRELKVQGTSGTNVVKYLETEPARLIFTATGRLPMEAFTADVEACVFVQGQGTY
jgi:hypothetical protein